MKRPDMFQSQILIVFALSVVIREGESFITAPQNLQVDIFYGEHTLT